MNNNIKSPQKSLLTCLVLGTLLAGTSYMFPAGATAYTSATINASNVTEDSTVSGTLTFTGTGTLNHTITGGTVFVKPGANVTFNALVNSNITTSQSKQGTFAYLTTNADFIGGTLNCYRSTQLHLTGGTLSKRINLYSNNRQNFYVSGNVVIGSGGSIFLQARGNDKTGANKHITINSGATLEMRADAVTFNDANNNFNNNGTLTLQDGTIHGNVGIGGSGSGIIDGNVTARINQLAYSGSTTINVDKNLILTNGALDDNAFKNGLYNNGTISLKGATLGSKRVTSGTLKIMQNLTANASYFADTATNVVDTGITLTLNGNTTLGGKLEGEGGLIFSTNTTAYAGYIATLGTNKVNSGVTLNLLGDASENATMLASSGLTGDGRLNIAGDVTINGNIMLAHAELDAVQEATYYDVTVQAGKSLTLNNLQTVTDKVSKVKNAGTMNVQGSVAGDVYNEGGLKLDSSSSVTGKVYNKAGGTVTVDGGAVSTGGADNEGTFVVNTGSVNVQVFNKGTYTVNDGAQSGDIVNGNDDFTGNVNINGGTINAQIHNNNGTVAVSGGTVNKDITNKGLLELSGGTVANTGSVLNDGEMNVDGGNVFGTLINHSILNITDGGGVNLVNNQGGTANVKDAGLLYGSGEINNAGGTMNIKSGALDNKITGGTINFGDTTQTSSAVTAAPDKIMADHNNILQGCTLTLNSNGTLAKGIDGAGTLEIAADVTASQKINTKLNITGTHSLKITPENLSDGNTEVRVDGKLVLNGDGTLNKNISGNGTVEMKTNHIDMGEAVNNAELSVDLQQGTLVNNGKLQTIKNLTIKDGATLDLQNKNVADNIHITGNLTADGTNYGTLNLDVALKDNWTSPGQDIATGFDKLNVDGNATGQIKLGAVNVFSVPASLSVGDVGYMKVIDVGGTTNTISFTDTVTVTSDGAKYEFSDASTSKGHGYMQVTKKSGYTLWEIVNNENNEGTVDNLAKIQTFSLFENFAADDITGAYDKMKTTTVTGTLQNSLGTLKNDASTSPVVPRDFTINGNSHNYIGTKTTNSIKGIIIETGQTLNLANIGTISKWDEYVVKNTGGTINIDKVDIIGSDIINTNNGTVNFNNGDIALNGNVTDSSATKTGVMTVAGANVTLGDSYTITQKTLKITGGSLAANASELVLDDDNISNDGTLILTDGTLSKKVIGNGTTQIGNGRAGQIVEVVKEITQNIKVAENATMKTKADYLQGTAMDNKGTVEFTADGTLSKAIYGNDGKVIIDSSVTLKTSDTADLGEQSVSNKGTLDSSGMSFAVNNLDMGTGSTLDLSGTAPAVGQTLTVNGNLSGNGKLKMDLKFTSNTDSGSLSYLGDSICLGGTVQSGTVLDLAGLNLNGGWEEALGKSFSVDIVTAKDGHTENLNELNFTDTNIRVGLYEYVGVQNETNKGQISFTKNYILNLSEIVQNTGTGTFKSGDALYDTAVLGGDVNNQIFAIGSENYKVDANLGTFADLTSPNPAARYLVIAGNNHCFNGDGKTGITVRSGDTLKLQSITEIKGFNGNVVNNKGTLEIKASTMAAGSVISSGICNESSMTVAGKILLNSDITDNATPAGTMTISSGDFTVRNSGSITQKSLVLNTDANLTAPAGNIHITEGVTNGGIVNLTDGTLQSKINGGTLNITGNVSSTTENLAADSIAVDAEAELALTSGTLNKSITNSGKVTLNGATLGSAVTGGTLEVITDTEIADASYIAGETNIVDGGANLTLTSGSVGGTLSGAGNIIINGSVKSEAEQISNSGTVIVETGKELELTAGVLEKAINNSGTVKLSGATLGGRCVDNGTLEFAEDTVISDIGYLGSATNKVASGKTLTVEQSGTGNLTGQTIVNDGSVDLGGDYTMSKNVFESNAGLHITGGTLNAEGSTLKLTGLNKDDIGKTFTLVDGTATLENGWLTPGTFTRKDNMGLTGSKLKKYTVAQSGGVLKITIEEIGGNFIPLDSKNDGIPTSAWRVGTTMVDNGREEIQKFTDYIADVEEFHGEQTASDTFNAVTNISSEAAVEQGTIGIMGLMGETMGNNLGVFARPVLGSGSRGAGLKNVAADGNDGSVQPETVEVGGAGAVMPVLYKEPKYEKQIWAAFMHNKEHIDGLQLDGINQYGSAQYNGTMVGCDLWSGKKSFGGIGLTYADGHVNSSAGLTSTKNEVAYYGVNVYNRVDNGNNVLITDIGFLRSENDITQKAGTNEITADAKINALTAGIRAEKIIPIGRSKLVPFAGVRYMYLQNRDYTSKINGTDGMSYNPDNQNIVMPQVGLGWNGEFEIPGSAWTFRPHVEGGYVWNLGDRHTESAVMFGGASDTIGYDVMDKSAYFVKLGMELVKKNITLGMFYKYQKGDTIRNSKWNFNANFAF